MRIVPPPTIRDLFVLILVKIYIQSVVSVDFQNAIPWAKRERGFSPNRPFGPFCEKRTPLRERAWATFSAKPPFCEKRIPFCEISVSGAWATFPRNHNFPRNHHFEGKSPAIVILNITVSEPWALLTHRTILDQFWISNRERTVSAFGPWGPFWTNFESEPWANRERSFGADSAKRHFDTNDTLGRECIAFKLCWILYCLDVFDEFGGTNLT